MPLQPTSSTLGLYQIILKSEHKFASIYINFICLLSVHSWNYYSVFYVDIRGYQSVNVQITVFWDVTGTGVPTDEYKE
jgi:hypothetical protein